MTGQMFLPFRLSMRAIQVLCQANFSAQEFRELGFNRTLEETKMMKIIIWTDFIWFIKTATLVKLTVWCMKAPVSLKTLSIWKWVSGTANSRSKSTTSWCPLKTRPYQPISKMLKPLLVICTVTHQLHLVRTQISNFGHAAKVSYLIEKLFCKFNCFRSDVYNNPNNYM